MRTGLVYDTESDKIPFWNEPSNLKKQPHIIQLAAKLIDLDTRECLGEMNTLVIPDGWSWDEENEAFKVHGITMDQCQETGIPEIAAVLAFFALWELGGPDVIRIGFSEVFDRRMIRIATRRYGDLKEHVAPWKDLAKDRSYCCMHKSKKAFGLPKVPKLEDIYQQITGTPHEGAHDAWKDVLATETIYWAIQEEMTA